jgi:hypothetical protein
MNSPACWVPVAARDLVEVRQHRLFAGLLAVGDAPFAPLERQAMVELRHLGPNLAPAELGAMRGPRIGGLLKPEQQVPQLARPPPP